MEQWNVLLTSREPRCWLAGVEAGGREEFIPTFTSRSPAQPSPVVTQTLAKQVPGYSSILAGPHVILFILGNIRQPSSCTMLRRLGAVCAVSWAGVCWITKSPWFDYDDTGPGTAGCDVSCIDNTPLFHVPTVPRCRRGAVVSAVVIIACYYTPLMGTLPQDHWAMQRRNIGQL